MRDPALVEEITGSKVKDLKKLMLSVNITFIILCLLFQMFLLPSIKANAETAKETIKVIQVGTSGGIPAVQASLENGGTVGTYSIVVTNPKTNSISSQELNSSGKAVTFAIKNFTENGTYAYTLQLNGLEILTGGVNLVSTKRTPTFVAQLSGTDLTIDVKGGTDFIGQTIFFKSGAYSNSLVLSGETMQRAFEGAKGTDSKITFSTEKGNLVTVDVKATGDKNTPAVTPPTANIGNNSGGNSGGTNGNVTTTPTNPTATNPGNTSPTTGTGNSNTNTGNSGWTTTPNNSPGGSVPNLSGGNGGTSGGGSNNGTGNVANKNTAKSITIALNQTTFKLEQTLVATVKVVNTSQAGRSITLRLGADANSTVTLLDLDNSGAGTSVFKIVIPQPSSKVITASAYTISGDLLDSASVKYSISNEVEGSKEKVDGDFGAEVPSAEYVSLDLSNLANQKATLAWYKARNVHKYVTKLKVINTTTQDEHSYAVFMPDGDSKINMNLVYDGPGVYTWELHSGGRLVAQAPYATPIGIEDVTAISQNGLPVLQSLPNKDLYMSNLEGKNPDEVNGAALGAEIGGVVADDVSGYEFDEPFNEQNAESNKKRNMLIGLVIFILIAGGVGFFLYRRKQNESLADQESKFVEYKADKDEENSSGDTSEFEEVQ